MAMRYILTSLFLALTFAFVQCQGAEKSFKEQFAAELKETVKQVDKDAAVILEEMHLSIQKDIMQFELYHPTMQGKWSRKLSKEMGPDIDGFMIEIGVNEDYDENLPSVKFHKAEIFKQEFLKSGMKEPYFNLHKYRFNNEGSKKTFLFDIKIGLGEGDGKEGSLGAKVCAVYNAIIALVKEKKY